jgi:hypothetical protein
MLLANCMDGAVHARCTISFVEVTSLSCPEGHERSLRRVLIP